MAQINTGWARMTTLTVTKGDYSHAYSILNAFPFGGLTEPAITESVFAQMEASDYAIRRYRFLEYVRSQEPGLADDCPDLESGSEVYDPLTCRLQVIPPGATNDNITEE
jgi:hypothetical protein